MQNDKKNGHRQDDVAPEKLKPADNPAPDDNLNQNHNAKKVAMGPNTKRYSG